MRRQTTDPGRARWLEARAAERSARWAARYRPDWERLGAEVAAVAKTGDERRAYWRRRSVLGDVEFYLSATWPAEPLRAQAEALAGELRTWFYAGKGSVTPKPLRVRWAAILEARRLQVRAVDARRARGRDTLAERWAAVEAARRARAGRAA